MKKGILIWIILFVLSGCCGIICERQKHAEMIIKKVEAHKRETGRLPENLMEIGIDDNREDLSFYEKRSGDEYIVWYGLDLGRSKTYNSKTKKWHEEG